MKNQITNSHSHAIAIVAGLPFVRDFDFNRRYYNCECGDGTGAVNTFIQPLMTDFYCAVTSSKTEAEKRALLRNWLSKNKWDSSTIQNPMTSKTVIEPIPVSGKGDSWIVPENNDNILCDCSKYTFEPATNKTLTNSKGDTILKGSLCYNVAPAKHEKVVGNNINDIAAHTALDTAGIYMPDINLHLGFEYVANKARDNLKRELVKTERKPLFNAYVKACNKYQLVCLPDQTTAPFEVCAGSVWESTGGCITRFCKAVEKALGRTLTRKEGIFVKAQWQPITAVKRARITYQSYTNMMKDDRTVYTTAGKAVNKRLHSLLDAVHGYSGAVAKLRKMLAANAIDFDFYNDRLAVLRKNRDKALEIIRTEGIPDTRDAFGRGRVTSNVAGVAPAKASTQSKRYAADGLVVSEDLSEYIGKRRSEDLRTPTIWKDGTRRN
jgi:hypothetical protein